MAVFVPVSSIDSTLRTKIETELAFQYKENTIVKSRGNAPAPTIVNCYSPAPDKCLAIPMDWAWKNLGKRNDYEAEKREFSRIKDPWSELQEKELAQVITTLEDKRSLALTLRTGAGKTAVCLFCACHFKQFTVVLVHIDDHCTQWYNSVKTYTTAKPEIVTIGMNGVDPDTDILICLYTRWKHVPVCVRKDVGLLIVDECDQYNNPTGVESIIQFAPVRAIGCTATFKSNMDGIMYSILGTEFVTRVFDVKFTVNKINTGISGTRQKAKYTRGIDWLILKQSLLYNEARNKLIIALVKERLQGGDKIMILCTEVDHVMLLYNMLVACGIDCDYLCGNKKTYKDSSVLVGGTRKCGRGFDEESFCANWGGRRMNRLILADYVNNETDLIQWLGRVFRCKDPSIDHLVDADKTIEKQWTNMTNAVYKPLGATIESYSFSNT